MPELASQLEQPAPRALARIVAGVEPQWSLVLDHDEPPSVALRPHLPFGPEGEPTAALRSAEVAEARVPLSGLLVPLDLDP